MIHAALVLVLAQYRTSLTLEDRTELRLRTNDATNLFSASSASGAPVFDLANTPGATLAMSNRRLSHTISYAPTLTLRGDALPGANPEILHSGSLRSTWRATRAVTYTLSESAAYGGRNFADLVSPQQPLTNPDGSLRPATPLQVLPATRTVHYGTTTTTFAGTASPAPRWQLQNSVTYGITGGTDATSRLFLPVQRRGEFETATGYAVTRQDTLVSTVAPSVVHVPQALCGVQPVPAPPIPLLCDHAFQFLDTTEGWTRRWTRLTTSVVSAGVSLRRVRLSAFERYAPDASPLVSVEVQHRFQRVIVSFTSRLGPVIDQRLGTVDTRTDDALTAIWKRGWTSVRGDVQYTQSVPANQPTSTHALRSEGVVTRRLDPRFDAEAGVRTTWQEQSDGIGTFANAFVALVYHEPRILF